MKLKIGPNIDDNRVRLDYKSSPDKPHNSPSYVINSKKSDEFVKKYNNQDEKLKVITLLCSILSATGAFHCTRQKSLPPIIVVPIGALLGLFMSSAISYKMKNNLMDKYDVSPYIKN